MAHINNRCPAFFQFQCQHACHFPEHRHDRPADGNSPNHLIPFPESDGIIEGKEDPLPLLCHRSFLLNRSDAWRAMAHSSLAGMTSALTRLLVALGVQFEADLLHALTDPLADGFIVLAGTCSEIQGVHPAQLDLPCAC